MARPKGTPNKRPAAFREALRTYCDAKRVDPHYWMVNLLARPGVKVELKLQAAKELAAYLEPKLKSVTLTGDAEQPLWVVYEQMPPAERQARIAALLAKRGTDAD